jgi:predicted lipoprotein
MKHLIVASVILVLLGSHGRAEENRTDYTYERIATEFVVPGYASFRAKAEAHLRAWVGFCKSPDDAGLTGLRESYLRLAEAWAAIEIVRSGPIAEDFRIDRLYFWPERKNAIERALKALLSARDDADLAPEAMTAASAAIQGLPALERLLFDGAPAVKDFAGSEESAFRCKAGAAIAQNAAAISAEITEAYAARTGEVDRAAKAALATDIVTAYNIIKDRKIEAVLGKDGSDAKPRLAEAWRSGGSLAAIRANLAALNKVAAIALEGLPEDVSLPFATSSALKIAESLSGDLGTLAAGDRRVDLILLRDAVSAAEDRAIAEIPPALGVTVGFNSLDGD